MATIPVTAVEYPTPNEVHSQLLSDLRYAYDALGITVNVKKGSELWERTWVVANRVSLAITNGQIGLLNTTPVDATGEALITWAATFGVFPRPASKAAGFVEVVVVLPATSLTVPNTFACTGPAGIKYETTAATLVSNGDPVPIQAIDAGAAGDLASGNVKWDSAAVGFLGQNAMVAVGGIDGGADADDEETLRARLLRKLSFPAVGGNWAHVAELAEASSAAITSAFVYPAERGPSSFGVAIIGEVSDPALNVTTVNTAAAAVAAGMPGSESNNTTTVVLEQLDIIINATLPLPVHAGGAGQGWHDATPWPSTAELGVNGYAEITGLDGTLNTITVNSDANDPPLIGHRFSVWIPGTEPADSEFQDFTVTGIAGGAGAWIMTVDAPVTSDLVIGMFCSAGAQNLQAYGIDFLNAMGTLGPGEKTTNADILQYARRRPTHETERPQSLTTRTLHTLITNHTEIIDLSYAGRFTSPATPGFTTQTTPTVPTMTANPPRMLTLRYLSIRRQV